MKTLNPTVVFTAPRRAEIEDQMLPVVRDGEVLIRTRKSLVSTGTEMTVYRGDFPEGSAWSNHAAYPYLPGYSNIGVVVEVGRGVDRGWLGKRVGTYGPHAMYVVAHHSQLREIHDDKISDEVATFFTIAEIVMNGVRRSKLHWGESAAVYGLGLLGQLCVQLCRIAGAMSVFAIDVNPRRLELIGRDPVVIPVLGEGPIIDIVRPRTRGRLVDVVFEVTGNPSLIPKEFEALREQGRFVLLSSPRGKTAFDFHDLCNAPSYSILGAHNFSHPQHATLDNPWTCQRDGELFFDLLTSGALRIEPLISHRVDFSEATRWYSELDGDHQNAMGVVFSWPDGASQL